MGRKKLLLECKRDLVVALYLWRKRQRQRSLKKARRFAVHPINSARVEGVFATLYPRLRRDSHRFFEYTRMQPEHFDELLFMLKDVVAEPARRRRSNVPLTLRLLLTLRFLASGDSFRSLSYQFRIGRSTTSAAIRLTCAKIYEVLQPIYLRVPATPEEWCKIAAEFGAKWQFPHCVGAIDGKHVQIRAPEHSGTMYFNHHQQFSIVLLAVVDANYNFIFCDVGAYGKQSDGGIFATSEFGKKLRSGSLSLPRATPIQPGGPDVPYVIVGDAAFPMMVNLMRPFAGTGNGTGLSDKQAIFNYRLSRARRIVENAFGILRARWRVFAGPIETGVDTVDTIVKATVCLHNFLRNKQPAYCQGLLDSEDKDDGSWRQIKAGGLQCTGQLGSNNASRAAKTERDIFADYFEGEGAIASQYKCCAIDEPAA